MTVFSVRIGVDEIATRTQKCEGFTFFCLPEQRVGDFEKEAIKILNDAGLEGFHGYKFNSGDTNCIKAYKDFLTLVSTYLNSNLQSFAVCRFFSSVSKKELSDICDTYVTKEIGMHIGSNPIFAKTIKPYFFRLACLAAVSRELAPEVQMCVEMDTHDSLKNLNKMINNAGSDPVDIATVLKDLYNIYAKDLHSRTPVLPNDGIKVLDDNDSIMVQAADVIGNFAMANIFLNLGKKISGNLEFKVKIFKEVFGDNVSAFDPGNKLTLCGDDFIISDVKGSLTFKIRFVITKQPKDPEYMKGYPQDDGFLGKGHI